MRKAIFTVVKNENIFLPFWLKHYSKWFDDIYVLNHESTDDSMETSHRDYDFREIRIAGPGGVGDVDIYLLDEVSKFQKSLLHDYEWVLYVEADEFVILNPFKFKHLDDYINKLREEDFITFSGREPLQFTNETEPIQWNRPVLQQRVYWWAPAAYHKTLLSRVPLNWVKGFHYTEEMLKEFKQYEKKGFGLGEYIKGISDPNILLVHLQKIDWTTFCGRGRFQGDKEHFKIGTGEMKVIPKMYRSLL